MNKIDYPTEPFNGTKAQKYRASAIAFAIGLVGLLLVVIATALWNLYQSPQL